MEGQGQAALVFGKNAGLLERGYAGHGANNDE